MYSFRNDYSEGAHPAILQKLVETNRVQQSGYGEDEYSLVAKKLIRKKIGLPEASVYFVSGGTQANLLVISSLLKVHEAVVSADSGHIYSHETGAIEAAGHRVIPVVCRDGKLNADAVNSVLKTHTLRPHVVKPRLVYISNSTELGTVYRKSELRELSAFCRANGLLLFMDGARLGHALTAASNDLTLEEIAQLTDVFYIGGTKNGALLGEAIVFTHRDTAPEFDYVLKQKGALMAKGRILGVQFLELFRDNLYFELADHANRMAAKIARAVTEIGYSFLTEPESNQLFPILPRQVIKALSAHYAFYEWADIDADHAAVRLITSWATEEKFVDEFIEMLAELG